MIRCPNIIHRKKINNGLATIKGSTIPVYLILAYLQKGYSLNKTAKATGLTIWQVQDAIWYSILLLNKGT